VEYWPAAEPIHTARLTLEPLRPDHADEMAAVLGDESLHTFIGGRPATVDELRARYAAQAVGRSPDGGQGWLNWVVRRRDTGAAVGTVQATLTAGPAGTLAELAWVIGVGHQGRGYAREAAAGAVGWLTGRGVRRFVAHVHPEHSASAGVAESVGLRPTDVLVDGEVRWERNLPA
jgi:RimJ/RimL family protein N-acetyltransferase